MTEAKTKLSINGSGNEKHSKRLIVLGHSEMSTLGLQHPLELQCGCPGTL